MADIDRDSICVAYEDVRNDSSPTNWATFTYEGNMIVAGPTGVDEEEFHSQFTDDNRLFGFLRVYTGDEMSKRAKFAFISWSGNGVSPLKRAKLGTDKRSVQGVVQSFAVELQPSELDELSVSAIRDAVIKAGGANYGTGVRD